VNMVSDVTAVEMGVKGGTLLEIASLLSDGSPEEGFSLLELKEKSASELTRFGLDLQTHFTLLGVTIPPALQLRGDNEGAMHVIGEHALKVEIEAFLNNNSRLLKWYKEIEVMHEILRSTELNGAQSLEGQVFNVGLTSLGCIAFFSVVS
jgi:hypothetical protein